MTHQSDSFSYDLYSDTATHYDQDRFSDAAGRWNDLAQRRALASLIRRVTGLRVLEIGCGTGRITEMLANEGAVITAIEPVAAMAAIAEERLRGMPSVRVLPGTIEGLVPPREEASRYDLVVAVNVFGRLVSPDTFLGKARQCLKAGGRLVFNFPNLASPYLPAGLLVNARGRSLQRNVSSRWYWPTELRTMLRGAGLRWTASTGHLFVPGMLSTSLALRVAQAVSHRIGRGTGRLCPSVFVSCSPATDSND